MNILAAFPDAVNGKISIASGRNAPSQATSPDLSLMAEMEAVRRVQTKKTKYGKSSK